MAIAIDSTSLLTTVENTSSVAGNLVTLITRAQTVDGSGATSWQVCVRLTGVNGLTPTIRVNTTQPYWSGFIWASTERGWFCYDDGAGNPDGNWFQGIAAVAGSGYFDCAPPSPLAQNVVWFGRYRRIGAVETLARIATLEAAFPSMVTHLSGEGSYQVDTFSSQTNELGGTVPAMPLYAGRIVDTNQPSSGRLTALAVTMVHASEDLGTSNYWAFMNWWCGATAEATALRRRMNLVFMPTMNPPGRDGGHVRAQFELGAGGANDLNRNFDVIPSPFQTVGKNRTLWLAHANPAAFMLDFHGSHSTSSPACGTFFTGSGGPPINTPFSNAWIARGVSPNAVANQGSTASTDTEFTDGWAWINLGAGLAVTPEFNGADYVNQADSAILVNASNIGLSLHDMLVAGYFGATAPTGSPFNRRGA